jgi:hypothetical protein
MAERANQEELDEVLATAFVGDVADLPTSELRSRRHRAEDAENRVSYARRLLQGRIDLVRAEALRRERDGELEAVLDTLSQVLADGQTVARTMIDARPPRDLAPPDIDDDPLEQQVVDLRSLSPEQLRELAESLAEHERDLSVTRRQLFDVIDTLQAELVERYRSGGASVDELLAGP